MKTFKAVDRIIFPLDLPNFQEASTLAKELNGKVGWLKVGLELFLAEGPNVIAKLKDIAPSSKIFLDLKLHDIPATVGRAMSVISELGADLITIHAQGGTEMMKEAVQNAKTSKILAVTVLTSLKATDLIELSPKYQNDGCWVEVLAERALNAGCHGLVSSGMEVKQLRNKFGNEPWLITPGIRPQWSIVNSDDQKRIVTPKDALQAGSDLLVIGRPIRDAKYPAQAAEKIIEEISEAGF